jgi:ribosomal peptide maturation radical SAM protein 1
MRASMNEPRHVSELGSKPSSENFRVALVSMPFAIADRPSIQVGLLSAISKQQGFPTDAYNLNLDLAAELAPDFYDTLCDHRGRMTGEWLFAPAAFGSEAPRDDHAFFEAFPEVVEWLRDRGKDESLFTELRHRTLPAFIERCLSTIKWGDYRVVGFSSTFQQNVASLALARRIKEQYPEVVVVVGGANMEGEMGCEYARAFPFLDYVVVGEGDHVWPALLCALAAGNSPSQWQGLVTNTPGGVRNGGQAAPVRALDALPVPDYKPYFDRAAQLDLLPHYASRWALPFESSRGCWWGAKHHCTFCGLNGMGMAFRAKSPQRMIDELTEMARRYRICSFTAVDNILDLGFISQFFEKIAERRADYRFFYEVKSNLTREQLRALHRGGVSQIQPGIESMSTHVLRLMRKGCTMLQNVRCLKWCRYYEIRVQWNLIWGFPGETEADYEAERRVLQCITHLEPPMSSDRIWLERFSPYYADRDTFPIREVQPEASYRHVYPEHVALDQIAYFFDYHMDGTADPEVHRSTQELVARWYESWHSAARHTLTYRRTFDGLLIDYNWGPQRRGTYSVFGPLADMYEYCGETMRTALQVAEYLRGAAGKYDFTAETVRDALDEYCRANLMLSEDGKYLALALPSNPNW